MTRRHHLAIAAATAPQRFEWLVESLAEAVSEVVAEGKEASRDSAVITLSGFVAFHTHADIASSSTFTTLLGACEDAISTRNIQ